jgi:DNA-binding transcriptional ArsR family regulator
VLQHDDPRLCDEALDWCVHHAQRLISISRLKRLRAALSDDMRDAYDEFAALVNGTARPKVAWPTSHARDEVHTSGKSQPPDLRERSLLQLRLRSMFGVTARADVLLRFLRPTMVGEASPTMILTVSEFVDLGYSKPAITEVLTDLAAAGLVERWRRGNRDHYELQHVSEFTELVGGALPALAPDWVARFRIVASLLAAEAKTRDRKPVVQSVAILKVLDEHRDLLERLSTKPPANPLTWPELTSWARRVLLDEREGTPALNPPQPKHERSVR